MTAGCIIPGTCPRPCGAGRLQPVRWTVDRSMGPRYAMTSASTAVPIADIGVVGLGVMGENVALNGDYQCFRVAF